MVVTSYWYRCIKTRSHTKGSCLYLNGLVVRKIESIKNSPPNAIPRAERDTVMWLFATWIHQRQLSCLKYHYVMISQSFISQHKNLPITSIWVASGSQYSSRATTAEPEYPWAQSNELLPRRWVPARRLVIRSMWDVLELPGYTP